jgi:PelA/Pel-15E family pectate lyase
MKRIALLLLVNLISLLSVSPLFAQALRTPNRWLHRQDTTWYHTEEAAKTAEMVLLLQKDNGGWPKNVRTYGMPLTDELRAALAASKANTKDATIDNGGTYSELLFLGYMYQATGDSTYKAAFQRGLAFVFSLQYPNGGFRQFARTDGYYTHITFNDNATSNILQLLRALANDHPVFNGLLDECLKAKATDAFKRGIDCILATQYVQNGKKTVWCAQHDEKTLLPAKARAYELPSLSGAESVNLVVLLMELPNPDERVKAAVEGAMAWFDANRIKDRRLERYTNAEGQRDTRMIQSTEGPDLWGRFCDLETNRDFVCDRDGIVKYDISEIGYERRNGYGWYTSEPERLFPRYERWKKKVYSVSENMSPAL